MRARDNCRVSLTLRTTFELEDIITLRNIGKNI